MELTHEILERLQKLEDKYAVMGQDMLSYLDGLLYADYLTYWEYIHLDTLLSLQKPKTPFPDEEIFIMYHQITELYFKLSIQAIEQVVQAAEPVGLQLFQRQVERVNRYFEQLIQSFDIMIEGMDKEEFLQFRMSLLPSSGFQSGQFRMIEIMSTDLHKLIHAGKKDQIDLQAPIEEQYQHLYWKSGATELATGKKTLTLRQFESKYAKPLMHLATTMRNKNLWQCFLALDKESQQDDALRQAMRQYDFNIRVRWPLSHLKAAARYLDNKTDVIKATGGTNWQKYLPPKNQRVVLFPDLWEEVELEKWGRSIRM